MRRLWMIGGLVLGLMSAQGAFASAEKISPYLKKQLTQKKGSLSAFVLLKEKADLSQATLMRDKAMRGKFVYKALTETAQRSQDAILSLLDARGVSYKRFYIANAVALYGVDSSLIHEIAERADVESITSNKSSKTLPKIFKQSIAAQKADVGIEGGVRSIGADKVWQEFGVKGEGIVVAGQDTGIDWDHGALRRSYRGSSGEDVDHNYNWHDAIHDTMGSGRNPCGLSTEEPCDDHAHGTHTIGTIVGDDGKGNQIGVAPEATWIGCRNMERGNGTPATYVECFEWFLAPYPHGGNPMTDGVPEKAPHVINNSWGCPESEGCMDAEILPALDSLYAAGIMVVASAGNDGPSCKSIKSPPAMHSEQTLSVGAHNHRDGRIASFSSRGPSRFDAMVGPDLTAPGVNIRSAVPGGGYSGAAWSGTSMAGPHVAGAVALLWSADESLVGQIDETINILRQTATAKSSSQSCGGTSGQDVPNNTFGYGHLDVYKAVASRLAK